MVDKRKSGRLGFCRIVGNQYWDFSSHGYTVSKRDREKKLERRGARDREDGVICCQEQISYREGGRGRYRRMVHI